MILSVGALKELLETIPDQVGIIVEFYDKTDGGRKRTLGVSGVWTRPGERLIVLVAQERKKLFSSQK